MYIHFLGGGNTVLPPSWADETSISVLSSTHVSAVAPPRDGAKLTIISILCKTTVMVPPGSRVHLSGGDILGSHSVDVEPSDSGPFINIQAIPVLGTIKIRTV